MLSSMINYFAMPDAMKHVIGLELYSSTVAVWLE